MKKQLFVLIIVDILVIGLWDYSANSINGIIEGGVVVVFLIIPFLILISGIWAAVLKDKKSSWAHAMWINLFIASFIFFGVFKYKMWKSDNWYYKDFDFTVDNSNYRISFKLNNGKFQDGQSYSFFKLLDTEGMSSEGTDLNGSYKKIKDTIILTSDKGKIMKVLKNNLFDYPKTGDTVRLYKK